MTPDSINIVIAEQVGDYLVRLRFEDGTEQTVDFKPFLTHALHPDVRAWLGASPLRHVSARIQRVGLGRLRPLLPCN